MLPVFTAAVGRVLVMTCSHRSSMGSFVAQSLQSAVAKVAQALGESHLLAGPECLG